MTRASLLYLASFGAHAVLAAGVVSLKGARKAEDISVAVIEKKSEPKKSTPPPPPPALAPKETAKAKVAPKAAVAKAAPEAPPPMAGAPSGADIPDFGLSLGGGSGGGGLAVPSPAARAEAAPASTVQVSKKLLAAPAPTAADTCTDPPVKPKVISISQPAYTQEARDASIAGKVRVELTVDATGRVSSARVLEGLGHGLDEAALAAARAATFEPGTRCGKAAAATFVIAMRFAL
ncbi:MAG: Ferric siderophore transport system, periplasmic binding protein TonB [Labilithrix sp.]|nr:Ferric siderophore transport system, periplasmic binding protein TonB [Labilithrix sp.]